MHANTHLEEAITLLPWQQQQQQQRRRRRRCQRRQNLTKRGYFTKLIAEFLYELTAKKALPALFENEEDEEEKMKQRKQKVKGGEKGSRCRC
jgi:hypothetical protein